MQKKSNNILIILLAISVIMAGGLFAYTYFGKEVSKNPVVSKPVDPETQTDEEVQLAGRNYIDSEIKDNKFTRTISMGNVAYLADDGSYQSIDTNLVESTDGYENTTNVFKSYFKDDSLADESIKFQIGERAITFSFVDANESVPVVEENSITYPNVYDGLDAKYSITNNELVEELIAEKKISVDKISQDIKLDGVYYKEQPDGSIIFHDSETKNIVFTIPRPVMYEQDNPEQNNFGLHFEISPSDNGYIISKIIDQAGQDWLAQANYPVVIDYTLTIYNPNTSWDLEGYIKRKGISPATYTEYPGATDAKTGGYTSGFSYYYRTFFSFDMSSLGSGTIESAYFEHYSTRAGARDDLDFNVYAGADAWNIINATQSVFESDLVMGYMTSFNIITLSGSCTAPVDCREQINIPQAWFPTIFTGNNAQFLFVCTGPCEPSSTLRGLRTYMTSYEQSREPRLVLEFTVAPPDLDIWPASVQGTLEPRLFDYSDNETSWVMQRSINGVNFSTICDNMVSGGSPGTCSPVATASYDCSATSTLGKTGEECSFTDTNLASNREYYYRAYAEMSSPYAQSPYSDIVSTYTLAAPVSSGPNLDSPAWDSIRVINSVPTDDGGANPADTLFCMMFDIDPTTILLNSNCPSRRYLAYLSNYYIFDLDQDYPGCTDGFSSTIQCHTRTDWQTIVGDSNLFPAVASGLLVESVPLSPNRVYTGGMYTVNADGVITYPTNTTPRYTRARDPSPPDVTLNPPYELGIIMDNTPTSATTYVNTSDTDYSMRVVYNGFTYYVNPNNLTLIDGSENWWHYDASAGNADPNNWGGGTGKAYAGGINICYDFQSRSKNNNDVAGEDETQDSWSTVTSECTHAAQPTIASVDCNYEDPGRNYYCQVTVNTNGNPSGTRYEIQRSPDGTSGWTTISNDSTVIYDDDNLFICREEYFYHVRAFNQVDVPTDYSAAVSDTLPPCPIANIDHHSNPICSRGTSISGFGGNPWNIITTCDPGDPLDTAREYPIFWYWLKSDVVSGADIKYFQVQLIDGSNQYCMAGKQGDPYCDNSGIILDTEGNEEQPWYDFSSPITVDFGSGDAVYVFNQFFRPGIKYPTKDPEPILPNTSYTIGVRGIDVKGRMGALSITSIPARSSIEQVQEVSITQLNITATSILLEAVNNNMHCPPEDPNEPFCYLGSDTDTALQFRETTGRIGGGNDMVSENFDPEYVTSVNLDDSYLVPNRQYCHQAKSFNEDWSSYGGEFDDTLWTSNVCNYTLADEPHRPLLNRELGEPLVNVTIRDTDDNPHGVDEQGYDPGTVPDTEYALCVTEYDENTGISYTFYVNTAGTVERSCNLTGYYNQTDCEAASGGIWIPKDSCVVGDGSGNWATYSGWGGSTGTLVDLITAGKYNFRFKARNGANRETDFGRPATLFLVKNNVVGWAWSSNIGWISLNCLNFYNVFGYGYSCDTAGDWGLTTYFEPTRDINPLEGYAWSASGLHIQDWLTGNINMTGQSSFNMLRNNSKTSVAIDSQGNPHVAWSEYNNSSGYYNIYYLRRINSVWETADGTAYNPGPVATGLSVSEDSNNKNSLWPSLALDTSDIPHIAWNEGGWSEIEWADQEIFYTYWNGSAWEPSSRVDAGSTPSLKLSSTDQPYVAFMHGWYQNGTDIYVRKLDTGAWTDMDGGADPSDNVNVSNTPGSYPWTGSIYPDLEIGTDDNPHVVWLETTVDGPDTGTNDDTHIYYRKWNGSAWVTASNDTSPYGCSNNFGLSCTPATEMNDCSGHCHYDDSNSGDSCAGNNDCNGGAGGTCIPNACQYSDISINEDLHTLGIVATSYSLNETYAGKAAADLALYPDNTPGVLFNDSFYFAIYRRWDPTADAGNGDWVDVDSSDGDNTDDLWVNNTAQLGTDHLADHESNYSLSIDSDGIPYVSWSDTDTQPSNSYSEVNVRYWNKNLDAWTTMIGDTWDNKLTPLISDNAFSNNPAIAVDEGSLHVVWADTALDYSSSCSSDANCTNLLYPQCSNERCVRTCTTNADCTNPTYPHCIDSSPNKICGSSDVNYAKWEFTSNKSGVGWISFNKYVCTNNTQRGCSTLADPSNECGGTDACIMSAGISPDAVAYGFCYEDSSVAAVRYGICSDDGSPCNENDVTGCQDPNTATCILETCQTGDTCSDYDLGPIVEDCRDMALANFDGQSRRIDGWARILSSKDQGERYNPPFTDWGWIKLGGQYDNGLGQSGNYTLSGTEIDSQLFLGDPDVTSITLSLYTLLGWGWNANMSDFNSISDWLNPTPISDNLNYQENTDQAWSDTSMVIDSDGDPHMAWSQYSEQMGYFDIYYAYLSAGQWKTITGEVYDLEDSNFDANLSNLDVSFNAGLVAQGVSSRFPSLALDTNDYPHIAGSYGTGQGGSSIVGYQTGIFYTYWNGTAWENYNEVHPVPATTPSLALSDSDVPFIAYKYGGWTDDAEIYLEVWNGDAWNTITNDGLNLSVSKDAGSDSFTPRLKLLDGVPHVTWEEAINRYPQIFYRYWDGNDWVSINETSPSVCSNNFTDSTCTVDGDCNYCTNYHTVSCTVNSECGYCENDNTIFCTDNAPCSGVGGVCNTASSDNDCSQGQCISESTSVNWGINTCGGTSSAKKCYDDTDCVAEPSNTCERISIGNDGGRDYGIEGDAPYLDFFSDGRPGVSFMNNFVSMFRTWNGIDWIDMDGGADVGDNLVLQTRWGEFAYANNSLVIDSQDQPHIIWTEMEQGTSIENELDIRYLYWDNIIGDWVTADRNTIHEYNDAVGEFVPPAYNVSNSAPPWTSQSSSIGVDQWGNVHLGWVDTMQDPTGWQCGTFDSDGIVNGPNNAVAMEAIMSPDDRHIYIVGSDTENGNTNWRIEKRRADNGELCLVGNCGVDFGSNGVIGYAGADDGSDTATDIALDSDGNYIYIVGSSNGGAGRDIRIQKRRADSGLLCTAGNCGVDFDFGDYLAPGSGIIRVFITGTGTPNNSNASIEVDDEYIYVVGTDDNDDWYIEKRSADTGVLVSNFGDAGVVISTDGYGAQWITIDSDYMYIVGGGDGGDWRIEKRLLSDGSLVTSFGNQGIYTGPGPGQSVESYDSEKAFQAILNGGYLYVAGNSDDGTEDFLIGKFDSTTGQPVASFDSDGFIEISDYDAVKAFTITADSEYLYFGGYTGDNNNFKWRMEKIDHNGNRPSEIVSGGWNNGIIYEEGTYPYLNVPGTINGIVHDNNYIYIVGVNDYPLNTAWRIEKRWKSSGLLDGSTVGASSLDCIDPDYPVCLAYFPYVCSASKLMYTRWTPGNVQGGIGWVEFMPAGALLGIPWVQTAFADIFATDSLSLAPPPRGSGEYTGTFLILSNGDIQGIPTNYSGNISQLPTSQLYESGLDPLISGTSLPFGEDALSKLDVDALITDNNGDGKNKYGHDLIVLNNSQINLSQLGTNPVLDNSVYYYSGNATIDDVMTIVKGDSTLGAPTAGNGLIVIDGDLEINANLFYDTATLVNLSEMPSVAFVVRGNIYVSPFVDEISGAFIALDNPDTVDQIEGVISTSRNTPIIDAVSSTPENDTYVNKSGTYTNNYDSAVLIVGGEEDTTPSDRTFLRWEFGQGKQFDIPPGSEILNAYIKLRGNNAGVVGDFNSRIYLIGDPYENMFSLDGFSGDALYNIKVNNSVNYELIQSDWNIDNYNITPDIKNLVRKYIDNEEYTSRYYDNNPLFMGIEISNGDATDGEIRTFYSVEGDSTKAPELVIEYSPRRARYGIASFNDTYQAYKYPDGNVPPNGQSRCGRNCPFGWVTDASKDYKRSYLRFTGIDIPIKAEIQEAHVRTELSRDWGDHGDNAFQMRTGLLIGYPELSAQNLFDVSLDQSVSEVAQDIADNQWITSTDGICVGGSNAGASCTTSPGQCYDAVNGWCKLESIVFDDITPIIDSFISRSDYDPGQPNFSELSLRFRRGNNLVENTEGIGEMRSIRAYNNNDLPEDSESITFLDVDYLLPIKINGLLIAEGFNFDRKYTKDLAPSERIVYDGRVLANTPPGLADFTKSLPLYQRVAP